MLRRGGNINLDFGGESEIRTQGPDYQPAVYFSSAQRVFITSSNKYFSAKQQLEIVGVSNHKVFSLEHSSTGIKYNYSSQIVAK